MSLVKENKLKQLYQLLPEGVVASSSWLNSKGYSSQLLYKYVKSGWLQKMGRGAYIRFTISVEWEGIILGLQHLSELPLHVGGLTALNLQGFAHYLPVGGENKIAIYGKSNPPNWIKNIEFSQEFIFSKKPSFGILGIKKHATKIRDWQINISTPERAILELLYHVEKEGTSFQFVSEIFEGLTTLSPKLLNELLPMCNSIKVKRLFLFFANHYNFSWTKHLNTKDITLGVGKMQIVKNGKYDKTHMITIPKDFNNG